MAGWMGLPDIDYTNPTVEEGRQHAFTLFREITEHEGRLYQFPIEEYKSLREEKIEVQGTSLTMNTSSFECYITHLRQSFKLHLRGVKESGFTSTSGFTPPPSLTSLPPAV